MAEQETEHRGHCFCGAVRFVATAEPTWSGICHCDSCRRATGGILMAAASFPRASVRFEGAERRFFDSSPGVRRGFCGACGTALSYENRRWPDDVNLNLANFEDPARIRPAMQIFTDHRLPWLHVVDDLPRYSGEPVPGAEESVASPRETTMKRAVNTGLPSVPGRPIEWATLADGILYTAQLPLKADGGFETGDIAAQTELTLANLKRTVEAAGGSMADVAQVMVYLTDAADFEGMNAVYARYFPKPYPNRATFLAKLVVPGARIEIVAYAHVGRAGKAARRTGSKGRPTAKRRSRPGKKVARRRRRS